MSTHSKLVQALIIKRPTVNLNVDGNQICVVIDTGATVNVMSDMVYESLHHKSNLQQVSTKTCAYGAKHLLPVLVKFCTKIQYKDTVISDEFFVAKSLRETLSTKLSECHFA